MTNEFDGLARRFEAGRPRLEAIAFRMLGSRAEAEEAVQDVWLRLTSTAAGSIDDVDAWLTTVVARVCLNLLRTRRRRREEPVVDGVPDPIVTAEHPSTPERDVVLADSVGLALLAVLDTLEPAERLAFVLHDMFDLPFEDIGRLVERTPSAARKLASRARRRVRGAAPPRTDIDGAAQRRVVDAFFAAARGGDLAALVAVLHPDAILRSDGGGGGGGPVTVRGAEAVARRALLFRNPTATLRPVRVDGDPGVVVVVDERPVALMGFTLQDGVIAAIHAIAKADRLRGLDLGSVIDLRDA